MAPTRFKQYKYPNKTSSGTFSHTYKLKPMKPTALGDEIFTIKQPKDYSNLALVIGLGVVITLCGVVFALGLLAEVLSK